ncbi:glycoside hydrolase family 99-like domain-containing protein, partial [Mycobacterium malmoense]
DIRSTIGRWRAKAQSMGLPGIYLCALRSHMHSLSDTDTIALGFDAIVGFEPHLGTLRPQLAAASRRHVVRRLLSRLRGKSFVVFDYAALVRAAARREGTAVRRFPCVMPSWDNSSRFARFGALVIQNDNAELFEAWLRDAANRVASYPDDEQLVFINAWNEWAEGCHLEPDRRNGHRFLEAVRNVFGGAARVTPATQQPTGCEREGG